MILMAIQQPDDNGKPEDSDDKSDNKSDDKSENDNDESDDSDLVIQKTVLMIIPAMNRKVEMAMVNQKKMIMIPVRLAK